ncbi:hypothetical protein [Hyphococcus sp.]|uniref:hypothetical protein n=1 Tax=Hyphococcus sp. TaxID=2038636 RepID=UPI003CCBFFB0
MSRLILLLVSVVTIVSPTLAQEATSTDESKDKEVTYFDIRKFIDDGVVEWGRVSGDGWWINIKTTDGSRYYAQVTPQTPIADHLYEAGIPVRIQHRAAEEETPRWLEFLLNLAPLLIFIVFFLFLMLTMGRSNKNHVDKYDDYLAKEDEQQRRYLERVEKFQTEFFERLEETIKRSMNNG